MARSPATPKPKVSEIALHMSVAAYLRRAWPAELPWTHFPAGEVRDPKTGGKLKQMGLAPGWPDFLFVMPNGQLAALELKARAGVLSEHQVELRDRLIACGCGYALARSLDEVEQIITRWLAAYGLTPRATMVQRRAA